MLAEEVPGCEVDVVGTTVADGTCRVGGIGDVNVRDVPTDGRLVGAAVCGIGDEIASANAVGRESVTAANCSGTVVGDAASEGCDALRIV
jgi:hypothetical protein